MTSRFVDGQILTKKGVHGEKNREAKAEATAAKTCSSISLKCMLALFSFLFQSTIVRAKQ